MIFLNSDDILPRLKNIEKSVSKIESIEKSLSTFASLLEENKELKNKIEREIDNSKKLNEVVNIQQITLKEQDRIITGLVEELPCINCKRVQLIKNNPEIINEMIGIVRSSNRFILILTNQIDHKLRVNDKFDEFYHELKNKILNSTVKVIIRYVRHVDGIDQGTTKGHILSSLGAQDSTNLDIQPEENLHFKLIMNENKCLLISNNLTYESFNEESNEIAVKFYEADNFNFLNSIKADLNERFGIDFD